METKKTKLFVSTIILAVLVGLPVYFYLSNSDFSRLWYMDLSASICAALIVGLVANGFSNKPWKPSNSSKKSKVQKPNEKKYVRKTSVILINTIWWPVLLAVLVVFLSTEKNWSVWQDVVVLLGIVAGMYILFQILTTIFNTSYSEIISTNYEEELKEIPNSKKTSVHHHSKGKFKCTRCNKKIDTDSNFCIYCGLKYKK